MSPSAKRGLILLLAMACMTLGGVIGYFALRPSPTEQLIRAFDSEAPHGASP